jgi:hypothetical protein
MHRHEESVDGAGAQELVEIGKHGGIKAESKKQKAEILRSSRHRRRKQKSWRRSRVTARIFAFCFLLFALLFTDSDR